MAGIPPQGFDFSLDSSRSGIIWAEIWTFWTQIYVHISAIYGLILALL